MSEEEKSRTRDPARGSGEKFSGTINPPSGTLTRFDRGTRPSSAMSHNQNRRKVRNI